MYKFMKKFCFLTLFSFFVQGSDGNSPGTSEQQKCDNALVEEVRVATSAMDMNTWALMNQTASTVGNAPGSSAKLAYQANAGVQGLLAGVATKKYAKCSSAIKNCKTVCGKLIEEAEGVACNITTGCSEYVEKYKAVQRACEAEKSTCDANLLQAGMSGLQMASSLLGARAIGDGSDNDTTPDPNPPPIPNIIPPPMVVGGPDFRDLDEFEGPVLPPQTQRIQVIRTLKKRQRIQKKVQMMILAPELIPV